MLSQSSRLLAFTGIFGVCSFGLLFGHCCEPRKSNNLAMVTNLALSMASLTVTLGILPEAMFVSSIDRDGFPNNDVFASIVMANSLFECNGPQEGRNDD